MERAVADDFAHAEIEIDARRERQVDAMRAEFGRHEPAHRARERHALLRIDVEFMTDAAQGRQGREAGAEPLNAAAFLVHGHDERRRTDGMDVGDQPGELVGVGVVAREQDDAAHERMAQDFAVLGRELETGDIDHQWPKGHRRRLYFLSSTATDSTCVVCGNISRTPAARKRKPISWVRMPRSRAREPVWQEIYTTLRGAICATALKTSRAPTRGGSNRTWSNPPRIHGIALSGATERSATWKSALAMPLSRALARARP